MILQGLPSRGEGTWTGSHTPTHAAGELPCLDLWSAPKKTGGSTEPHSGAPPAAPPARSWGPHSRRGEPRGHLWRVKSWERAPSRLPLLPAQRRPGWTWGKDSRPRARVVGSPFLPSSPQPRLPAHPAPRGTCRGPAWHRVQLWDRGSSVVEFQASVSRTEGLTPEFQTWPGPGLGAVCSATDQRLGLGAGEGHWR